MPTNVNDYITIPGVSIWNDTSSTYYTATYQQYREQVLSAQYAREQQVWVEHQQMMDEQARQAKELEEDKKKYPLFFLKEGIV